MPARSTLLVAVLLPILTSSCGNGEYSGSYVFPTAIIGIRTQSPEEAAKLERQVTAFAVAKNLDVYHPTAPQPIANPLQRSLTGDSFNYAPNPPDVTHGFSMLFKKLADGCFIVQFSERSPSWTPQSLASLTELQRRLLRSFPGKVHSLVRAKPEQNWPERQRLRYMDPEWPDRLESLCDRMKLSEDAAKESPPETPSSQ